jgi:hypothetical protein
MINRKLTSSRCQCAACGDRFNSAGTFDRHRIGGWQVRGALRRCLTTDEMRRQGWTLNAGGFWIRGQRRHLPSKGGLEQEPLPQVEGRGAK